MLKTIKRIVRMSGKFRGKLYASFVMGFLENTMAFVSLFCIYLSLLWLLEGAFSRGRLILITSVLIASVLLRFVFKLMEYRLQSGTGYEIICNARLSLGEKLNRLSMGFFSSTDAGDISSMAGNDLVFVEGYAMAFLSKVIGASASAVMMLFFLFWLDWRIALCSCIAYPIVWLIDRHIRKIMKKHAPERQEAHARTSGIMLEYLQGLFVIKAFGMAGKQEERLKENLSHLEKASYDFEMKSLPWATLYLACLHICTAVILMLAAYLLAGMAITLSSALFIIIMIFVFYAPLELLGMISGIIRLMNVCLDRTEKLMEAPVLDSESQNRQISAYNVRFDNVSFSYDSQPVLRDISFSAPEHTMTGIVGASGSGKSTILSLIARFWDVNSGTISIGGADIRQMTCSGILENISVVFQKAYLFHDTIYNNIRFGKPNASREQVIEAANKARCHDFISALPQGYDTVVGEGGSTLSGGERQRVSIARALLKDAPIVLLDEVTANIDPENEMLIQEAIDTLVQSKTVFIIAHKLSTIQSANQILVLNTDGQIAETGTHKSLMEAGGIYASMWEKAQKVSRWALLS